MADWTFLTDHAHVLVVLARDARSDAAAVAKDTGIEVDAVRAILAELEQAGYIRREREGAAVYTRIDRTKPLRHRVERHHPVGRLLDAVQSPGDVLRARLAAKE